MSLINKFKILFITIILFFSGAVFAEEMAHIQDTVVKVYVTTNMYNYDSPWQSPDQNSGVGSGVIIDGHRILTNAHVVADGAFIEVRKAGDPTRFQAYVEMVGHDCDLAVLRVEDESFFDGVKPLKIGEMPRVQNRVAVVGFPIGGEEISITEGIISRIEQVKYSHQHTTLLACQIDAAINSGNSGGPVIMDEQIVGVAFQADVRGQNIGYIIPVPVINHFLQEVQNGEYHGFPDSGIYFQPLENPDLRQNLGMKEGESGILITDVTYGGSAEGIILKGDVVLRIDGHEVANDGSFVFRAGERLAVSHLIQKHFFGEEIQVDVLRDGERKSLSVYLDPDKKVVRLVPVTQYDQMPSYYIVGGLVFQKLNQNYLENGWGRDWLYVSPKSFLYNFKEGRPSEERREIVVLSRLLPGKVNVGYQNLRDLIVEEVNGVKIAVFEDLVEAFEKNQEQYHEVLLERNLRLVIDRTKTEASTAEILKKYHIQFDRSEELRQKSSLPSSKAA